MTWGLRITATAIVACVALCLMIGSEALRDALTRRPDVWWIALLFLVPSLAAVVGVFVLDDDA